jgi:hypothetical protein
MNRPHQLARHGDSAVWQTKQGAGRRITGACMARVKFGNRLLLVCAFFITASTSVSASPDVAPPRSISFAYRMTHPAFPLPLSAIASVREPYGDLSGDLSGEAEAAAWEHDEPAKPEVVAKPRVPSQPELCREVAAVAHAHDLPVPFFGNLIWAESSFNSKTISRAGAQGIAQFMPKTAVLHGLDNPFEPIHAINVAAKFLVQLREQFGNLGLAAAAYNAGPTRLTHWLAGRSSLPRETQNYVLKITGRPVSFWVGLDAKANIEAGLMPAKAPCIEVAEAVLEQTKVVTVSKLMRELAASAAANDLAREEPTRTDARPARHETKWADAKSSRKSASARTAKHKLTAREARKLRLAEKKRAKIEASAAAKRGGKHAVRDAAAKGKRANEVVAAKPAHKPVEKPAPTRVATLRESGSAARPAPTPARHHRGFRRTRIAYTTPERLH